MHINLSMWRYILTYFGYSKLKLKGVLLKTRSHLSGDCSSGALCGWSLSFLFILFYRSGTSETKACSAAFVYFRLDSVDGRAVGPVEWEKASWRYLPFSFPCFVQREYVTFSGPSEYLIHNIRTHRIFYMLHYSFNRF